MADWMGSMSKVWWSWDLRSGLPGKKKQKNKKRPNTEDTHSDIKRKLHLPPRLRTTSSPSPPRSLLVNHLHDHHGNGGAPVSTTLSALSSGKTLRKGLELGWQESKSITMGCTPFSSTCPKFSHKNQWRHSPSLTITSWVPHDLSWLHIWVVRSAWAMSHWWGRRAVEPSSLCQVAKSRVALSGSRTE